MFSFYQHADYQKYTQAAVEIRYCKEIKDLVVGDTCGDPDPIPLLEWEQIHCDVRPDNRWLLIMLLIEADACENIDPLHLVYLTKLKNIYFGLKVVKGSLLRFLFELKIV